MSRNGIQYDITRQVIIHSKKGIFLRCALNAVVIALGFFGSAEAGGRCTHLFSPPAIGTQGASESIVRAHLQEARWAFDLDGVLRLSDYDQLSGKFYERKVRGSAASSWSFPWGFEELLLLLHYYGTRTSVFSASIRESVEEFMQAVRLRDAKEEVSLAEIFDPIFHYSMTVRRGEGGRVEIGDYKTPLKGVSWSDLVPRFLLPGLGKPYIKDLKTLGTREDPVDLGRAILVEDEFPVIRGQERNLIHVPRPTQVDAMDWSTIRKGTSAAEEQNFKDFYAFRNRLAYVWAVFLLASRHAEKSGAHLADAIFEIQWKVEETEGTPTLTPKLDAFETTRFGVQAFREINPEYPDMPDVPRGESVPGWIQALVRN